VLVRASDRNLERLGTLLVAVEARDTRRRPLDQVLTELREGGRARFRTRYGGFDVMTEVPAEGDFAFPALARRATRVEIAGLEVKVAALDDLIAMKERAHRVKDLARLPELRRIRELLDERAAAKRGNGAPKGRGTARGAGGAARRARARVRRGTGGGGDGGRGSRKPN
jgi:hypothetical protein